MRPSRAQGQRLHRRLALLSCLAVALVSVLVSAPASPAATAPMPILAQSLSVSAPSGARYVSVRLRQPLDITKAERPTVTGDLAAQLHFVRSDLSPVAPSLVVLPRVLGTPASVHAYLLTGLGSDGVPAQIDGLLPAGDYRLYVVATKPTTVSMRLPLPGASVALRATLGKATGATRAFSGQLGPTGVYNPLLAFGAEQKFTQRGRSFLAYYDTPSPSVYEELHFCIYPEGGADSDATYSTPGCMGADFDIVLGGPGVRLGTGTIFFTGTARPPGTWAESAYLVAAGALTEQRGIVTFIDFGPEARSTTPSPSGRPAAAPPSPGTAAPAPSTSQGPALAATGPRLPGLPLAAALLSALAIAVRRPWTTGRADPPPA